MKIEPIVAQSIEEFAERAEYIEAYTKYTILVTEETQIFVQFEGVPNRGSVTAWVALPKTVKHFSDGTPQVIYNSDEEPRTVGFLRQRIDDLDYNIGLANAELKNEENGGSRYPDGALPFLRLTVITAEELRDTLVKELDELWNN